MRKIEDFAHAQVSIHAPTRGATPRHRGAAGARSFNPRTHEGCDGEECGPDESRGGFNPRTHEGCDMGD